MKTIEKNDKSYKRMKQETLERIKTGESREILGSLGIQGQVIITDYHSPGSITFIFDEGQAVVGDLPPEGQMMPDDARFLDAWEPVRKMGGRLIYPSHAEFFELRDKN